MNPIRLFHSPDWDGYGDADAPPPPPSWLTEGLTSHAGFAQGQPADDQQWQGHQAQQGWVPADDQNAYESGGQEPVWEQAPDDDQPTWSSPYPGQQQAEWSEPQQIEDTANQGWESGGGYSIPPPQAPGQYANRGDEFDQFPTQGEGVPSFGGGFGQPSPPPAISHQAEAFSAPSFNQPSVASLRNRALEPSDPDGILLSPVSDPDPMRDRFDQPPPPPPSPFGGFGSMEPDGPAPPAPDAPAGTQQSALYTGTLDNKNKGASAITGDGVPRYVPEIPEYVDDDGELGCRAAAGAYAVFGVMLVLGTLKSGNLGGAACVLVPVFAAAGVLLTGRRWAAILTMVLGSLWGLLFIALGLFWHALINLISESPITLPPLVGFGLIALGITFITGNALMLFGSPRIGRAVAGALLMLIPFLGFGIAITNIEVRPSLNKPTGLSITETVGGPEVGFTLTKPDGWNSYDWNAATLISPLAKGLTTKPTFFFVDRKQQMMLSIYTSEPPRRSLTQLFGQGELSELETEISRGLPPKAEKPDEYPFAGQTFSEMTYEGTTSDGNPLSIILSHARVSDEMMFHIVLTRNTKSTAKPEDATAALNAFFKDLAFEAPASEKPTKSTNLE
ncbi:hypothetical protein GC173_18845 [bacterium]|nr:hypothetical protein [bacterium]